MSRTGLVLALAALLSAGCAEQNIKQMVARPKPDTGEGGVAAERRVVLFRVAVDVDGQLMEEPWSLHFSGLRMFTIVGPKDVRVRSRRSFLPGRPSSASSDEGWAFVALVPGSYQLAFEGMAIRFAIPGSEYFSSEALPVGRSPPSAFVVPTDASLIYIGSFSFTCREPTSRPDALKLECTTLEVRNEAQLARQVAQNFLSNYGPMQEGLAAAPVTNPSH
jgi:hypothetical protein